MTQGLGTRVTCRTHCLTAAPPPPPCTRTRSDPHAANMLIRPMRPSGGASRASWWWPPSWLPRAPAQPRPQLVILDHGLYRRIPDALRLDYCKLWRSILLGDAPGIQRYSTRMGAGGMYQLWASMLTTRSWDKILEAGDDIETLRVRVDARCGSAYMCSGH